MEIDEIESDSGSAAMAPTLQNIVSTVNLGCKLSLKDIALKACNAEYNPKRFFAVIMRIKDPQTTALIFASGRMVCTGAKTVEKSKIAAKKFARVVLKLGFPVKLTNFTVQNIVSSCDVSFAIWLERFACSSHGAFTCYEPELFPRLVYRIKDSKITILVFASGKVVITGAKTAEENFAAFDNIFPVILEFRR